MISAKQEKYLVEIYANLNEDGFTRVSQLAKSLDVSVPSVSKMARKLKEEGFIEFQRYGMITLTPKGNEIVKQVRSNHDVLARFFQLIEVEEDSIKEEVNKIESYISHEVIKKLDNFLSKRKLS
ncbi:metal-dependent transcriptional regulator [Bacillus sinesaloumensis]|uniref:metal-dependent transcriptional regulator n=1 Tax=Litchfieldia sinesaloumensis TaxID=1926280 RepID=UPI00098889E7|nr:metal-dependent transcriptional regulator [Bacillus sinesaloumensis]